jgi:two-component system, chemotaxis family, response regulator Rcp1
MKAAEIVLVEDNSADVYLVELALKESDIPYNMTRFETGDEAVNVLCRDGSLSEGFVPDAILLDLNTPRSDGFEVLLRLKQTPRLANVPMAVISSSHAVCDQHRSALQRTRYIEKPSQLAEFLATVGQAVKEMLQL